MIFYKSKRKVVCNIELPEVAEEELLALVGDIAETDDVIDDEGDTDETD
jgi:type I restriction enzyme S subunit